MKRKTMIFQNIILPVTYLKKSYDFLVNIIGSKRSFTGTIQELY